MIGKKYAMEGEIAGNGEGKQARQTAEGQDDMQGYGRGYGRAERNRKPGTGRRRRRLAAALLALPLAAGAAPAAFSGPLASGPETGDPASVLAAPPAGGGIRETPAGSVAGTIGGTTGSGAVSLGAVTDPFLGQRGMLGWSERGFGRVGYSWRDADYGVTAALGFETGSDRPRFDGTMIERYFGNWTLGAGLRERHWSPSRYRSLILSRNARPLPSVWLEKSTPSAFETPLLAWLGPWDGEVFVTGRDGSADARLFGMRLRIRPLAGLEIDFQRTAQWSGGGLGRFGDMLIGRTNEGRSAEVNQMAGVGISWRLPEHVLPARFYVQAIGEDESGGLPSCFMYLGGVELETRLGDVPTRITLEGVDTRIKTTGNGFCGPDTAYNHHTHPYTRDGRVMGAAIDSEGREIALHLEHELPDFNLSWGVSHVIVNDKDNPDHRLSSGRVSGGLAYVGVATEWQGLEIEALLAHQGFALDRADSPRGTRLAVGVTKRF